MASHLSDVSAWVFEEASDVLGVDISAICRGESSDSLTSTRWAQPAIVTVGVAAAFEARELGIEADALAGHSLGEYTALVVGGSLSLSDGLSLVDVRAQAMDAAGSAAPGTMAAVGRLDNETVETIAADNSISLAADNAPGQLVISGHLDGMESAIQQLRAAGGKVTSLDVSGAFHSQCMAGATKALRDAADAATVREPQIDFYSSVTASRVTSPVEIRDALVAQLVRPVRWRATVVRIAEAGVDTFLDCGPGRVALNLVKRCAPGCELETFQEVSRGDRVGHRAV